MIRKMPECFFVYRVRSQIGSDNVISGISEKNAPTVAVLDTGSVLHPDLDGRIIGFKDFINNRKPQGTQAVVRYSKDRARRGNFVL